LGRLLLDAPDREREYIEALAWFQLAGEQGIPEAKDLASRETAKFGKVDANAEPLDQ
jgi:hypothetical protein